MNRWGAVLALSVLGGILGIAFARHQHRLETFSGVPPEAAAPRSHALREVTSIDELHQLLRSHPDGVVLDFHAQWCVPCQELAPRLESLALHHPELVVAGVDAATYPKLADAYAIDTLPALVHLEHGTEIAREVGAPSEHDLELWLGSTHAAATAGGR